MKKMISIFLTLVVLMSVLCACPASAESDYGLQYIKVGNNLIVEAKGLGEKSADLYMATYQNGRLVEAGCYDINAFVSERYITMEEGLDYKFFVWENTGKLTPVFKDLTVNTQTSNGVGTTEDAERIKVRAEIVETPKSNPYSCIDYAGKYMVRLRVVDGFEYTLSDLAKKLGLSVSTAGGYFDVLAYVGDTNADNMLGEVVVTYFKNNTSTGDITLTNVSFDSTTCTKETITENINTMNVSGNIIKYYASLDDSRMTEIDIASTPVVYYNGVALDSSDYDGSSYAAFSSLQDLLINADKITFIGYKNAAYDKIFVTDYTYKVVKSVYVDEKLIKFDPAGALDLDAVSRGNEDFIYNIYDANGNAMDIADIKKGDVLNIVCPLDYGMTGQLDMVNFLDIYVTNETVTGMVESYWTTTGKYTINGKEYAAIVPLLIGEECVFYLSIDGKIVKKDAAALLSRQFALMLAFEVEATFGINRYTTRLLTADGINDFIVAPNVRFIDGSTGAVYKTEDNSQDYLFETIFGDAISDKPTRQEAEAKLVSRFFMYETNDAGQITEIRRADSSSALFTYLTKSVAKWDSEFKEFGGEKVGEAKLFVAPLVNKDTTGMYPAWNVDTDLVSIFDFESLDEYERYAATLYMFEGEEELAVALTGDRVVYNINKDSLAVVSDVYETRDSDGETVVGYKFIQNGESKTLQKDYDIEPAYDKELAVGDIFFHTENSEGEISEIVLLYDASARELSTYAKFMQLAYDGFEYCFGVITDSTEELNLASCVDDGFKAITSSSVPLATPQSATYAFYDEANPHFPVTAIDKSEVFKTTSSDGVYAAFAKVNSSGTIDDVVVIALETESFSTPDDINMFTNWKLPPVYTTPDEDETFRLETSPLAVIQAIGTKLDADENTVAAYTVVIGDEVKTVAADYDEYPSGLGYAVGDIFQYAVNADDEIVEAELVYDASARSLTSYATAMDVTNDDVAFVFGVISKYSDYIELTSNVDVYLGSVDYVKLRIAESETATYAWYEEALTRNPVNKIELSSIRETVRVDTVYAAVAKVNEDERVEDIVVIALNNADFNDYTDINNFPNWKLSVY